MDYREAIYLTAAVVGTLAGLVCIWEFLSRRAPALGVPAVPSWRAIRRGVLAVSVVLLFGSCCVCSSWLWQAADRVQLGNFIPAGANTLTTSRWLKSSLILMILSRRPRSLEFRQPE